MRKALFLLAVISLTLSANAATPARYQGGSVPTLPDPVSGTLDTAADAAITFHSSNISVVIPYAAIDSFEYTEPVARRLGVLPTIAVSLLKRRRHIHLFRITYHSEESVPRLAIFEVPKQAAGPLNAVLTVRVRYYKNLQCCPGEGNSQPERPAQSAQMTRDRK